jgi:spermidine synthase
VLILGGGDGMAVREVLRHPSVETVQLVDLDPAMTRLFSGRYAHLNDQALSDPRVQVTNADAMRWIEEDTLLWDAVIIDFPDPNDYSLGKLYTTHFYRMLADRLAPGGAVGIQSTSPFYAAKAYWCVIRTLEASGLVVRPYQTWVPAFGMWGYALASREALPAFRAPPAGVRSLDAATLDTLFVFPPDTLRPDVPVNRLDNQALVALYEDDWREMGAN